VTESEHKSSWAEGVLSKLADAVYGRPALFIYPQILLFCACVAFTVMKLEFSTSRSDLVGTEKRYHRNFLEFKKEFPSQDDLVVIVESDDMEKNRQFVERLGARLEAETELFQNIIYKGDLKMLGAKALLFLDKSDLEGLEEQLKSYHPFVKKFSQATNLVSLIQVINTEFRTAEKKPRAEVNELIESLPALQRIIDQCNSAMNRLGHPPSPGLSALFGGAEAEREMYITYGNGRMYLATAQATESGLTKKAVNRLRELVEVIKREIPGVSVGVTGEPVLEFDEMDQSQKDTLSASMIALLLVGLIFIYGYQETGRPIKATVCLLVGLGYTMGYTTLVVGHLNILTITFAPMLIGLAIDFGVHLITRYEEELRAGLDRREAIRVSIVNTGQGVFTGALTTAAAFFAMALTDFRGIQEMGIIAGGGLLVSLVPMMTLLPALLLKGSQNKIDHKKAKKFAPAKIESFLLGRPKMMALATAVVCGLAVWQSRNVYFDYNLLHMQSADLPAVIFEEKLIESASNSVLFGALMADSVEHANELEEHLRKLPTVADVKSMTSFLGEDPGPRLGLIGRIKDLASSIRFAEVDQSPFDIGEASQVFYSFQGYLGASAKAVREAEGESRLYWQIKSIWESVSRIRKSFNSPDSVRMSEQAARFQQALLVDLQGTFAALAKQDASGALTVADLPTSLRNRFVGVTGKYLLQIYPKEDVWQKEHQAKFVADLRRIDPDVTGTPVQLLEYTTLLKDSYIEAAWWALGTTALMVLIHFRSLVCMILALIPVAVGTIWLVGIMGWHGLPFNPANIMTLPLVAGIGVTSGIHILNRFQEERTPSILAKSTGKAVFVSALTTVAGFGSLTVAEHRGIESLGLIMSVGTLTCMVAALVFLPAVISLLMRMGWKR
jgi:hopanoid biosynthesis associated RND transporter like protein HpnN